MKKIRLAAAYGCSFLSLFGFFGLFCCGDAYCQTRNVGAPVEIKNVFDPKRIKEARYKLVLFNQDRDTVSNIGILDRSITREDYENRTAIRITEILTRGDSRAKTIVVIDAKTLMPLYFEDSSNGTMTQKAYFDQGKEIILRLLGGEFH